MMLFTRSAFRKVDVFGSRVGLTFNKDNEYMSGLGGVISIFFVALMAIFFWSNIYDMLAMNKVKTTTQHFYDSSPLPMELSKNKFMFAVQIAQDNYIKNPYFHISLSHSKYYFDENNIKQKLNTKIDLEPCTLEHWIDLPTYKVDWEDVYKRNNLQDFYCPKKDYNATLSGDYTSEEFKFLKLTISTCLTLEKQYQKLPWKPVCRNQTEIEKFTKNSPKMNVYFSNVILNPEDPDQYKQSMLNSENYFYFQPGWIFKSANILFTEYDMETDQSILPMKDIKEEQYIRYENNDFREQIYFGDQENYGNIYLRRSYITVKIERGFEKFDEVIAYIGGFVEAFLILLEILVGYYNESLFTLDLANKLYDFELNDSDSKISSTISNTLPPQDSENDESNNHNSKQRQKKRIEVYSDEFPPSQSETNQKLQEYEDKDGNGQNNPNNNYEGNQENRQTDQQDSPILKEKNSNMIRTQFRVTNSQILKEVQDLNSNRNNIKNQLGGEFYNSGKSLVLGSHRQSLAAQSRAPILKNIMGDDRRFIISPKYSDTTQNDEVGGSLNVLQLKSSASKVTFNTEFTEESEPVRNAQSHLLGSTQNKIHSLSNFIFKTETDEGQEKQTEQELKITSAEQIEKQSEELSEQQSTDLNYNKKSTEQNNNKQQATSTIKSYFQSKRDPSSKRVQFLKNEFEKILTKNNKLEPTFSYFIYQFSCQTLCKSRKNQLLHKAQDMVEDEIDIPTILSRLKQVDKMKELFLNREQQILFNFFPKPVVQLRDRRGSIKEVSRDNLLELQHSQSSINQKGYSLKGIGIFARAVNRFKTVIKKEDTQFQTMSAYQKLYECFIICEKDKDQINKKLIGMLGKEINSIFDKSKQIQKRHPTMRLQPKKQALDEEDQINSNQNEQENQDYEKTTQQVFLNVFENESPGRLKSELMIPMGNKQHSNNYESPQLASDFKINGENTVRDSPLIQNTDYKQSSFRKSSFNLQMQDFSLSQDILNTQALDSAKPLADDNSQQILQTSPLRKQKWRTFSRNRNNKLSNLTILDEEPFKEKQNQEEQNKQQSLYQRQQKQFNSSEKQLEEMDSESIPPPIKRNNQQDKKEISPPQSVLNHIEEEDDQQSHNSQQIQILQMNESDDETSQKQE